MPQPRGGDPVTLYCLLIIGVPVFLAAPARGAPRMRRRRARPSPTMPAAIPRRLMPDPT